MPNKRHPANKSSDFSSDREVDIRIIGGEFRGRRLNYHGDPLVRPMKHRTREAIFNLIGIGCGGRHAIDLFAGTGALGLEALSRGSTSATFIEKHVPTARIVEENIRILSVEGRAEVLATSAFLWAKRDLQSAAEKAENPWLVFCSPPYSFYNDRQDEMLDLIARIRTSAPPDSILVVEAEVPFDFGLIQNAADANDSDAWDIRTYQPAIVGIWESNQKN
jgi:16S rRNA (guanine(966)-N(2))-methyltransferase RsmD